MQTRNRGSRQRNRVATIFISVQISITWLSYSLTQTVLRIAPGIQRLGDIPASYGQSQLDSLMRSVGRGALEIWLRMVMRDITRQEDGSQEERKNLQSEIANDEFTTPQPVRFNSREVTHGILCIFLLYKLLSTANSQIGDLRVNSSHHEIGEVDGVSAADHCRGLMQFSFAANRILGDLLSLERL